MSLASQLSAFATRVGAELKTVRSEFTSRYATKDEARLSVQELTFDPAVMVAQQGSQLFIPGHIFPLGGQTTHPSVLFMPEAFGGYEYWMAHTPYASGNDAQEDPNIVASHDGITWVTPSGLTNPLDDQPGSPGAYNSDVDLKMGPNNVMYLFWRTFNPAGTGAEEKLYYRTSTNGVTWTPKVLFYSSAQATRRLLSPSLVFEEGKWTMWAVDIAQTPNAVVRLTSTTAAPESGWTTPITVPVGPIASGKEAWHIFVLKAGGKYFAILNDCVLNQSGVGGDLYFLTSGDGKTFSGTGVPFISKTREGIHDSLYRSTMVPAIENGIAGFRVWYVGWRTGPPSVWDVFRTFLGPSIQAGSGSGTGAVRKFETGGFTRTVAIGASGGFAAQPVTFAVPFASPPHVNVVTDSGRISCAAAAVTTTGFNFNMNNWTPAQANNFIASWSAEDKGSGSGSYPLEVDTDGAPFITTA